MMLLSVATRFWPAYWPRRMFLPPVVSCRPALYPTAVLLAALVPAVRAALPTATLKEPVALEPPRV